MKILIIDDEINRQTTYEYALDDPEFEITFKSKFTEDQVESNFDLCILDYYLGGDGMNTNDDGDFLQAPHILKNGNPIGFGPVIIVSDQIDTFFDLHEMRFTTNFTKLLNKKCSPSHYLAYSQFELTLELDTKGNSTPRAQNAKASLIYKIKKLKNECKDKICVDIVVMTALDEELSPLLNILCKDKEIDYRKSSKPINGHFAEVTTENSTTKIFLLHNNQMGHVETMSRLAQVNNSYEFKHIVMIGVCGGREGVTKIGDVVIPKKSISYVDGKLEGNSFLSRSDHKDQIFLVSQQITPNIIKGYAADFHNSYSGTNKKPTLGPKIHTEAMLSGNIVVNTEGEIQRLAHTVGDSKACSVDMESYAIFYFALNNESVDSSCVIKTVMDLAGDSIQGNKKSNQNNINDNSEVSEEGKNDNYKAYCCELSAHVFLEMVKNEEFFTA